VLLVLDNVEQVLRPMASTLSLWLDRAPQARFLATSRERLGLPDEQVLALDPLSAADAAVLFCQRASAHASDIAADDPSVLALVRLLDGLPLAIELAAARVHVLPPDQMLARMDQRFRLLAGGGSGRPERQATLHAALDWSWDLLGDAERSALAQLSVFEGGFTLAAAESVLDLGACGTAPWVPDVLQALVDKSLVRIAAQGRFDLLRSVQAYAAEQLCAGASFPASGSTLEGQAHSRHWRLFATLDARAGAHRAELENLSLACTRAAAAHDGAAASACLTVTWGALRQSGPYRLVPALAAAVRAIPGLEADHVAATEAAAAAALATLGDLVGAELAVARGLAAIDEARSPTLAARLHGTASEVAAALGDTPQARMHIDRARQLAALPAVDVATRCQVLNAAGAWASDQGHLAEARIVYEEALALARAAGDQRWQGALLGNLGGLHHVEGQLDAAAACYQQSLAHLGSVSDSRWIMNTRGNLGMIHLENGRSAEAAAEFTQALTMARSLGQARVEAPMLCNLGLVADAAGDMALAGERYSAAVDCAQRVGDRRSTAQFSAYRASALARTGRLAEAQSCIDHGRAAIHGLADPLGEGLLWCSLAELHDAQGRDCTPALERTQAVLTAQGWAPESELGRRHACVVTRLRRAQRSRGNPMHPRRGGQGT
jgi:tetratricopeptide (TPR) repeat protein